VLIDLAWGGGRFVLEELISLNSNFELFLLLGKGCSVYEQAKRSIKALNWKDIKGVIVLLTFGLTCSLIALGLELMTRSEDFYKDFKEEKKLIHTHSKKFKWFSQSIEEEEELLSGFAHFLQIFIIMNQHRNYL